MGIGVSSTGTARAYLGPIGVGKTQRLVQEAASLVASGTNGSDVLVLCASPQAVGAMARRLREAGVPDVRVETPRSLALQVLSVPEARAFTGRRPAELLPFEEEFLLDDVRVLGVKDKRVSEMMKFFDRMDDELRDEPEWLCAGEETTVRSRVNTCLRAMGALRDVDVCALAVRYLLARPDAAAEVGAAHVLVDDYTLLGRASQVLASMLAGDSETIAADPYAALPVFDRFPYAAGAGEFLEANPTAEVVLLEEAHTARVSAGAARSLVAAGPLEPLWGADGRPLAPGAVDPWRMPSASDAPTGGFEVRGFRGMEDEMAFVADEVARAVEAGAAPEDVAVLGFRPPQMHRLSLALKKRGVAVASCGARPRRSDVHDPQGCDDERALALLALAADRNDAAAWRAMVGFGDSLGRSWAFDQLRAWAESCGMGVLEALETAPSDARLPHEAQGEIAPLLEVHAAVARQLDRLQDLRGSELLQAVAQATVGKRDVRTVKVLAPLLKTAADDDTAAVLYERARRSLLAPAFGAGVRVGMARDLQLASPKVLFVMGFVNGFIPPRRYFDKTAIVEKDARALWVQGARELYGTLGAADARIVVTYFTRIDPERAQRTRVYVERIRVEDGERVCVTAPSDYLAVVRPDGDEASS